MRVAGLVGIALLAVQPGAAVAGAHPAARVSPTTTFSVTEPTVRHVTVPLEPIRIQKIGLPAKLHEASTPVFTRDGKHLLFFSQGQLWRVSIHGRRRACLTCGLAHRPTLPETEQEGFATEFPDRSRVFLGAANSDAVLECAPSVIHCRHRKILPVDLTGARPPSDLLPPGGADVLPALDQGGASSPKLSPDGKWVAFSDVTTDAVEMMTIARLRRGASSYTTSDPRVLNPAGPASPTSTDATAWSNSSALFELKSFARGGADITYAQVGGAGAENPDVWQVNLRTGRRHRLTAGPDWDEDDAPSPDGRSIVVESDRTMHRVDMLGGLFPVRDFIDAPIIGVAASYFVGGAIDRQCDLQPWLFPASGDRSATLMGQPLQPYAGGAVHAANNVSGYPQWSPDGTEIALNTESFRTNRSADYLLVAHLTSRRPRPALRIVSSRPGAWAKPPADYHGATGATTTVVLRGSHGGTATVAYGNVAGVVSGTDSITYRSYSENPSDTVDGTVAITNPNILTGPVRYDSHLTMTGKDTGSTDIALSFTGIDTGQVKATGPATVSYDGTTVSGLPHVPADCPQDLPRAPRTRLSAHVVRRHGRRFLVAHVTGRIAGDGANEAATEVAPVTDASVRLGSEHSRTDRRGLARIPIPPGLHGRHTLVETAGDTLRGDRLTLSL